MSVKFKTVARKNPRDPAATPKYYATNVQDGEISFKELVDLVAFGTTLTKTDALAALSGLEEIMIRQLKMGKVIRFGDFGSFHTRIHSAGSVTEEEVSVTNILNSRIRFRPGAELRECLKTLTYKKVSIPNNA